MRIGKGKGEGSLALLASFPRLDLLLVLAPWRVLKEEGGCWGRRDFAKKSEEEGEELTDEGSRGEPLSPFLLSIHPFTLVAN